MRGVCLKSSTGRRSKHHLTGVKLTWQELIRVHQLESSWNICVHTKHASYALHTVRVLNDFIRNRRSKLKYLQLRVTCPSNVSVHVDFVVVRLLKLNDKGFKGGVSVTF